MFARWFSEFQASSSAPGAIELTSLVKQCAEILSLVSMWKDSRFYIQNLYSQIIWTWTRLNDHLYSNKGLQGTKLLEGFVTDEHEWRHKMIPELPKMVRAFVFCQSSLVLSVRPFQEEQPRSIWHSKRRKSIAGPKKWNCVPALFLHSEPPEDESLIVRPADAAEINGFEQKKKDKPLGETNSAL